MNHCMIVDNGIRLDDFQFFRIKLLNVPGLQPPQGTAFLAKIWLNATFDHALIRR